MRVVESEARTEAMVVAVMASVSIRHQPCRDRRRAQDTYQKRLR